MHFFTSVTTCYIPKARVLAATLKKYNPDAVMHLVISDDLPKDFDLSKEDFDYVWKAEDFIQTENNAQWFFSHTVVELCTAVKGAAALHIFKQTNTDKLVYLDPDIGVFNDLTPLSQMLDTYSILLTPHQTEPSTTPKDIEDNELCSLQHGIYNFGFFAVKNDQNGMAFLNWWSDRLIHYCYDDIPKGLFTDQKWGDFIPALFDGVKVIREQEYNVATWNLVTRKITGNEQDGWFVNGCPLRFFHFTGYDSGAHREVLARYASETDPVWKLSQWYEKQMDEKGQKALGKIPFKYAFYENGEKISKLHRIFFRNTEVKKLFANPFNNACRRFLKAHVISPTPFWKLMLVTRYYQLRYHLSTGHNRVILQSMYKYYKRKYQQLKQLAGNM